MGEIMLPSWAVIPHWTTLWLTTQICRKSSENIVTDIPTKGKFVILGR